MKGELKKTLTKQASNMAMMISSLLIVIIIGSVFTAWFFGVGPFRSPISTGPGGVTTVTTGQGNCPATGCVLTLPVKFTLTNLYTGGAIDTGATDLTILKPSGSASVAATSWETGGTDSNGVWTTTRSYHSGDIFYLHVSYGNSKYQLSFQVPVGEQSEQTSLPVSISMNLIGTYTLGILEPDGVTAIAGSGNYNVTTKANTSPRFSITVSNSADDTGFTGTFQRYDIIENNGPRTLVNALAVKISETSATPNCFVKDWTRVAQTSDAFYYLKTIGDHAVNRDVLPDTTIDPVLKGTYSDTFTVDATALPAGDTEVVNVYYYVYLSVYYYGTNLGATNTETLTGATITFNLLG